jgi:hypothetical protein
LISEVRLSGIFGSKHWRPSAAWPFLGPWLVALCLIEPAFAARTYEESKAAATTIGKWISASASHYELISATPIGPRRAGKKFFVRTAPLQMASDYGISYMRAPASEEMMQAYEALGFDTSRMARALYLTRLHAAWSFDNEHDFSYSYLSSKDLAGWGLGYKRVFHQSGARYFSYRIGYTRTERENWYRADQVATEVSASIYLRLVDFYGGLRHVFGQAEFESSIPELRLPEITYFAGLEDLEYFLGAVLATSVNTRLTLQMNLVREELKLAGKLSFRFDELYPTYGNWFKDPRALKQ